MDSIPPLSGTQQPLFPETFRCSVCRKTRAYREKHGLYFLDSTRDWMICNICAEVGKHCPRCQKYYLFSAFAGCGTGGTNRGSVGSYCKECRKAYNRERYKKNGKSERQRMRELARKLAQYGLTPEQYQQMLEAQGGVCAVCGQPETATGQWKTVWSLAVDHDHDTGQVRALLCSGCNVAFGALRENPERIQRLLDYAKCWQKPSSD